MHLEISRQGNKEQWLFPCLFLGTGHGELSCGLSFKVSSGRNVSTNVSKTLFKGLNLNFVREDLFRQVGFISSGTALLDKIPSS